MIFAIHNFFDDNNIENYNNKIKPVISHNLYNDRKPVNDWDNLKFFLIIFSILFFYGDGGYIIPQFTKVFFYIWAKWALL